MKGVGIFKWNIMEEGGGGQKIVQFALCNLWMAPLQALSLVRPSMKDQVLDPPAVLHLDNGH